MDLLNELSRHLGQPVTENDLEKIKKQVGQDWGCADCVPVTDGDIEHLIRAERGETPTETLHHIFLGLN